MKKVLSIILALLMLSLPLCMSASAMSTTLLVDNAELLSSTENTEISKQLAEISEKYSCDVVIFTTEEGEADGDGDYAEELYGELSYKDSDNACILLVDMGSRKWEYYGRGLAHKAVNEDGFNYLADKFEPLLSEGEYYDAFSAFIDGCDELFEMAENGKPYTEPFSFCISFFVALAIGIVLAFIVTAVMKGQLKSVRSKADARDYVVDGSFKLTENRNIFLYRNVSRVVKPQSNNSSSGRSFSSGAGASKGGGSF